METRPPAVFPLVSRRSRRLSGRLLECAWSRLKQTAHEARRYRDLQAMLVCGACYQAGVATIITLAAIYAQEVMGFKTRDTLMLVLVVNITACIGAFGFGYVQDSIGKKRTLMVTLFIWLLMVGVAWLATTPGLFWLAANLAGLAMGFAGRSTATPPSGPSGRSRGAITSSLYTTASWRFSPRLNPLTVAQSVCRRSRNRDSTPRSPPA